MPVENDRKGQIWARLEKYKNKGLNGLPPKVSIFFISVKLGASIFLFLSAHVQTWLIALLVLLYSGRAPFAAIFAALYSAVVYAVLTPGRGKTKIGLNLCQIVLLFVFAQA